MVQVQVAIFVLKFWIQPKTLFKSGVAKPLPGGKEMPAKAFSCALQICFILQNLILKNKTIGTGIELDLQEAIILFKSMFKLQLALWFGFLRSSFAC